MFQIFFISLKLTGSYNDVLDGSINLLKRVGIGNFAIAIFRGENSPAGIIFKEIHWRQFLRGDGYFPDTTKYVLEKIAQMENIYYKKKCRWKKYTI